MYQEIINQFGSPVYLYQLDLIDQAYKDLLNAVPVGSQIYYSLKANPHPSIVKHIISLGAKAEVSSLNELEVALLAGARADECLYTGPAKTEKELLFALRKGVKLYSIESWNDATRLVRLCEICQLKANAIIRINPSLPANQAGLSMTGVASQFGIDEDNIIPDAVPSNLLQSRWLHIRGLHIFHSTNLTSAKDLMSSLIQSIRVMANVSSKLGFVPRLLDLGGGFGCPFGRIGERPDFSSIKTPLENVLDAEFPLWRMGTPKIAFETGRYLTSESGSLITTVMDMKTSKNKTYIVVDTGIHHLGGMSALGRIPRTVFDLKECLMNERPRRDVTVVGPLCTPLDYLVREVSLAEVQPGDIYHIPNVGAYGLTASLLGFLSRETPAEVIMNNGKIICGSRIILSRTEIPFVEE